MPNIARSYSRSHSSTVELVLPDVGPDGDPDIGGPGPAQEGVVIVGDEADNLIDAVDTVPGQPLPTEEDDLISGGGGNDTIDGLGGNDEINGDEGDDLLAGGEGRDELNGGPGNDTLDGGPGFDRLNGGEGDDTYVLGSGIDRVRDSDGVDTATSITTRILPAGVENLVLLGSDDIAGVGNRLGNTITGNSGENSLLGAAGDDTLLGNEGDDVLSGGAGSDTLVGGLGADTLIGGPGDDSYVFETAADSPAGEGRDVIGGFNALGDADIIDLSGISDEPLDFIAEAEFDAPGQVRVEDLEGPGSVLQVNLDDDPLTAEMEIRMLNVDPAELALTDFLF